MSPRERLAILTISGTYLHSVYRVSMGLGRASNFIARMCLKEGFQQISAMLLAANAHSVHKAREGV